MDCFEFQSSLGYKVSSEPTRAMQQNPASKNQNNNTSTRQNKTKETGSGDGLISEGPAEQAREPGFGSPAHVRGSSHL